MNQFNVTGIKTFNVHPIAWQQQNLMLEKLKELPDYIETEIHHHYDRVSNSVSWYYNFKDESNTVWEAKVVDIIEKHKQPA